MVYAGPGSSHHVSIAQPSQLHMLYTYQHTGASTERHGETGHEDHLFLNRTARQDIINVEAS